NSAQERVCARRSSSGSGTSSSGYNMPACGRWQISVVCGLTCFSVRVMVSTLCVANDNLPCVTDRTTQLQARNRPHNGTIGLSRHGYPLLSLKICVHNKTPSCITRYALSDNLLDFLW